MYIQNSFPFAVFTIHTYSYVKCDTGDVQNLLLVNEEAGQREMNRQSPDAEGLGGRGGGRGRMGRGRVGGKGGMEREGEGEIFTVLYTGLSLTTPQFSNNSCQCHKSLTAASD